MKRTISVSFSVLALAAMAGCASRPPPAELVDARAAYSRARSGPAFQYAPERLNEAAQALYQAEQEFERSPGSDDVETLAYVAQRKAQIAEAQAGQVVARTQQDQADKTALQMQAERAQREASEQREAAQVSDRRAKVALEQLGIEAQDEPEGTVITLPDTTMFATDEATIQPEAKQRLAEIAQALDRVIAEGDPRDEGRTITLVGYTDATGPEEHNMELSERRAEAVHDFLAQHGIDEALMETEARGEAEPVATNETPEGRAENRRVEIVITPRGGAMTPEPTTPEPMPREGEMPGEEPTPGGI